MKQVSAFVILLSAIGYGNVAKAQTDTAAKVHLVSAQEAVSLALKQRTEIVNARLDIENQKAVNAEVTGSALPQIKASGNAIHYFSIPVTVLPDFISPSVYGVLQDEGVKDGNGNPITAPTTINTFPAQFGTPWQASVGVAVNQLMFQPDIFVGLQARKATLQFFTDQLAIQEDSVKSNVLRSYYGVLIAQRGLGFAKESEARLAKLSGDQGELFKNGFIERLDLDKTQVSLNNIRTTIKTLQNLVDVGYAALKFSLSVPQADSLVLTDSLSNDKVKADLLNSVNDFKYENRSEIRALNTNEKLLGYQVKRQKLGALPTIGLGYNLSTSAQRQEFDFFKNQRWFVSNYIGLNVSVPIFDGNQRRSRLRQAEIALEKNRNTLNNFKQLVDFQLVAAKTQLTNAIASLSIQEENKELAERVFATTKLKYEQGLGSSFEVLQSETSLQDALNNYYQALYNAVIARIGYNRALGTL